MQLARNGVVTLCTAWLVCVAGFSPASLFLGVPKKFGWRAAPLRLCYESRCALRRVYAHLDGGPGDVDESLKVKLRKAARQLLTLEERDPKRLFEGDALIRRIVKLGLLKSNEKKLDYVLGLTTTKIMERRLQTKVLR